MQLSERRSSYHRPRSIDAALAHLAEAGIIDVDAHGTHRFHQTLLRDVVYGAMLSRHREELHGRVGLAIENARPEVAAQQPSVRSSSMISRSRSIIPGLPPCSRCGCPTAGRPSVHGRSWR